MKIENIEQLREHVLDTLQKLSSNEIKVTEAGIVAKSAETIMSSLKLQLAYSSMLGDIPNIAFLHDCHKGEPIQSIDQKARKALMSKLE